MNLHELEMFELSQVNSVFNGFTIANLIIRLYIAFLLPTKFFPCTGAPTTLSMIIETFKARHDSR